MGKSSEVAEGFWKGGELVVGEIEPDKCSEFVDRGGEGGEMVFGERESDK